MRLDTIAKRYTTPLTLRVYEALPGNTLWTGIGFTVVLLMVFLVGRSLVAGCQTRGSVGDFCRTGWQTSMVALAITGRRELLDRRSWSHQCDDA